MLSTGIIAATLFYALLGIIVFVAVSFWSTN
jgi:hypothetical protein